MDSISHFDQYRPLLFSIAYRMLGNIDDAEDMIQETFLRWTEKGNMDIESPKAYFSLIITRLCIDHLKSAKVKRESYIGPWLPEPLSKEMDSLSLMEQSDSISLAFLTVLENLSPQERAVYLLKHIFDYRYQEIAPIVGKSEEYCRKLFSRARQQLVNNRPRFPASKTQHEELLHAFTDAYRDGNLEGLLAILAKDSVMIADAGGKVPSALKPIYQAGRIADFLVRIHKTAFRDVNVEFLNVNGKLSLLIFQRDKPQTLISIEANENQIEKLLIVRNPDKLHGFVKNSDYITAK